ncbi:VOC family protein [Nocardioides terrisoli]|uniref:VOC family protein n=1 Tax=Nocardioides terrisoli TaxID=3388267 RepID=UPI00287BA107|nr:VOC family protein [Nocardioides marmorisolisilvae]
MALRLNPYLHFDSNAREALEAYHDIFGGELTLSRFGDFGDPDAPEADLIMHGMLQTPDGFTLMGADTPPGMEFHPGRAVTISLSGDDAETLRGFWQRLVDGGTVEVELAPQMWGDEFGQCVDRFGVSWLVDIAGSNQA